MPSRRKRPHGAAMSKFYGTFTAAMETWRQLLAAKGAITVDPTVIFCRLNDCNDVENVDCWLICVVCKPGHIFLVHPGPTSYLNSFPSHNEERRAGLSLPFVSLMGVELLHSASFLSPCPPQFSMHGTYVRVRPSLSSSHLDMGRKLTLMSPYLEWVNIG